ncbi:MAG: glycosyltransferase [Kiritimatiellae bacterium]|nr:glycosyltransferase [Kiritimatiellia bacterium]
MRIAIVHYHLRPGGVTRVIQHAVSALRGSRCQVAVLTGYSPDAESFMPGQVHIVPGLDYPQSGTSGQTSSLLVATLEATAQKALGGPPDIWHFHNHTLGKNTALSQAVYQMALRGQKLLLQIHDFPEDGRPANYRKLIGDIGEGNPALLASRLYPQAHHVHYATINSRDRVFLCQAGMPESHVHLLPNAIDLGHIKAMQTATHKESERLFVYPTRALRRKNIGEFLLWSTLARQGDRFATTLAPTSPADLSSYQQWVALARRLKLPVTFEIGRSTPLPFPVLLSSAAAIVTTSVAEGFGLAFLEPWLVGRPLTGRDLPEITDDFKAHDIHLDGLYRHVLIPRDWIDLNIFRRKIESGYSQWRSAYGRPENNNETERAFQAAMVDDRIDFGRLDEALQQNVICRLAVSTQMRSEINPHQLLGAAPSQPVIIQNREAIRRIYGSDRYRRQLERLYTRVGESGSGKLVAISEDVLLDRFLAPDRFYLLRT